MSLIQISDLNPAGSDLFAGAESFLTDLQDNDSSNVFGGGKKGRGGRGGKSGSGSGKGSGKGRGRGRGRGYGYGCNGGGSSH